MTPFNENIISDGTTEDNEKIRLVSYSMGTSAVAKGNLSVVGVDETSGETKGFQYQFMAKRTEESVVLVGLTTDGMPDATDVSMAGAQVFIVPETFTLNVDVEGLQGKTIYWDVQCNLRIVS